MCSYMSFLKYVFVTCGYLFFSPVDALGQTTYYVSNDGNDSNSGTSATTPLRSINKINQIVLRPGDRVLLRRGDIFRGGLIVLQSGTADKPIVIDAYGNGKAPIIAGSVPVSNWTSIGNNVWQATCSQCGQEVTGVYNNETALPLGRYPNLSAPNKGYLTVQSHVGKTQLTSKESLTTNWIGSEVVVRPLQWILDKATITQQTGNTLTINNSSIYDLTDGWGYFIQKHPATLDYHGEWYYNAANKTIRLFYDKGNPNNQLITAAVVGEGFTTYNQSYITVQNIQITQTANIGFYAATTKNLVVRNVSITNCGLDGVQVNGRGDGVLFENCLINHVNNNGFHIQQYANLTFRGNTIKNVGIVPGRGKSGDGQYLGFGSYGESNILIENNILDSLGYNGIVFANTNHTIQKNVISNFCMTKSDGAGLYVWNGNKQPMSNLKLLNNIIYRAIGAPEGSIYTTYSGANGIYLDDCSQNIEIKGNTVFDCFGIGIFLHATTNVVVEDNTSYGNREGQFVIAHNNNFCTTRDNIVQNNIFVSKNAVQSVARYESVENDLNLYGVFDNNYYARPFDDIIKIGAGYRDPNYGNVINGDISLFEWQALYGKDTKSKGSPLQYKDYTIHSVSNAYKLNSTFANSNDGWYPYSYHGNGRATWTGSSQVQNSLQVDFSSVSGRKGSYVFVYNGVGSISRTKSYILRFEAVASADNKSIQLFLRQRNGTYQDLTPRYSVLVGTTRKSYEIGFKNPVDETDAIIMMKIAEDGKVLWLDNISLQEAVLTDVNPDNYIKFVYNTTDKDSLVTLHGSYLDVKNNSYDQQVQLPPRKSLVLLKKETQVADLSLTFQISKKVIRVGEIVNCRLNIHNHSASLPTKADWVSRLPSNVLLVSNTGINYQNGIISGTVKQLSGQADTVFTFQLRVVSEGNYQIAAQLTSTSLADPDSNPSSGTADGEDDAAVVSLRTLGAGNVLFESPNPDQRILPAVQSNQPMTDLAKADLKLLIEVSKRSPIINDYITYRITVKNDGGADANSVQIKNKLATGLKFVGGEGWSTPVADGTIVNTIPLIKQGDTVTLSFTTQVTNVGIWTNQAQVNSVSISDPDSTPGNGYFNGEDDQAQIDIRVSNE